MTWRFLQAPGQGGLPPTGSPSGGAASSNTLRAKGAPTLPAVRDAGLMTRLRGELERAGVSMTDSPGGAE